ncbi:hypothetical protein G5V58_04320 [Nocardioides anomalus]|uniref:Bacterial Ig-like domain-containing protein n=1 Tax=Nocardioides anomalus TaxID=2712223 RepID=A0A6G6W9T2_9ACTN|nr:Ig-like domain-containing protein [Nocardioides anomalus]QIG42098.1 hypothetical protein G5V58_04320 [Nocardioides anomalus]
MREKLDTLRLLVAAPVAAVALGSLGVVGTAPAAVADAPAATTTTLASSVNPSTAGQAVAVTASVTGSDPTGTVTFLEGSTTLGSAPVAGGVATLTTSTMAVGSHTLTATYEGDGLNAASTSAVMTQFVNDPPKAPKPPKPVKKPVVKLSVSTTNASVGDQVTLRWSSKNADEVRASGEWKGRQKSQGSTTVRLTDRGTHVFRLTVKNAAGKDRATVKVTAIRKAKSLELTTDADALVLGGTAVDVTADGLAQGEAYVLRVAGKPVFSGKADKKGEVHRTVKTPLDVEGELAITLTGSNAGRVGTATLQVVKPTKDLGVELKRKKLPREKQQTVTVSGLVAGEEVTLSLGDEELTTEKASEDGTVTYSFAVGDDTGVRTVSVVGMAPGRTGEGKFTVLD